MKKFYTTLFAACAVFGASAAIPQVQFNPEIKCNKVATAESMEMIKNMRQSAPVKLESIESRADDYYCTEASFHYDDITFACFDQLGMAVTKTEKDGNTVYTVDDFYYKVGQQFEIVVDSENYASVALQKVWHVDEFWSDGSALELYTCSYSELPKIAPYLFKDPATVTEAVKHTATYDPLTGAIRLPLVYLFYTELNFSGTIREEWYPFAFTCVQSANNPYGFLTDDYEVVRKETLQLGDYGEPYIGKFTDPFLVTLGFEPDTWDVAYQYNTLFPNTIRIANPYVNDPQLGEDEFKKYQGGELVEGLMYIYCAEGRRYIGNTYAGLNMQGTEFGNFAFNSYIEFYLQNANPWSEVKNISKIENNGDVLSTHPFGIYKNPTLEFDAYANLFVPVVDVDALYGEMSSDELMFVSNDYFRFVTSEADGVQAIAADNTNAPVEYFNLQGVRVENPRQGMFIRRQGTEVAKVVL